ncbi:MAG: hypothetical protein FJ301_01575 [Planctomycetes bacterium]|nr:hypothetical protein [Planctomycetota bacterium]
MAVAPILARCSFALALGASLVGQTPPPPAPTTQPTQTPPPPAAPVDPIPVLDGATFADHWQHIVPTDDEMQWRAIPWLGTLAEAVVQAHAQDKPILLWAMNGHPLACT